MENRVGWGLRSSASYCWDRNIATNYIMIFLKEIFPNGRLRAATVSFPTPPQPGTTQSHDFRPHNH